MDNFDLNAAVIAGDDRRRQILLEMLRDTLAFQMEAMAFDAPPCLLETAGVMYLTMQVKDHLQQPFSAVTYGDLFPEKAGRVTYGFTYLEPHRTAPLAEALRARMRHGIPDEATGRRQAVTEAQVEQAVAETVFLYGDCRVLGVFAQHRDAEGWYVDADPPHLNSNESRAKLRTLTTTFDRWTLELTLHPGGANEGHSFRVVVGELRDGDQVVGRLRAELIRPSPGYAGEMEDIYEASEALCDDLGTLTYVLMRRVRDSISFGGAGTVLIFTDWQTRCEGQRVDSLMLDEAVKLLRKSYVGLATVGANVVPLGMGRFIPVGLAKIMGNVFVRAVESRGDALEYLAYAYVMTPTREQREVGDDWREMDAMFGIETLNHFDLPQSRYGRPMKVRY